MEIPYHGTDRFKTVQSPRSRTVCPKHTDQLPSTPVDLLIQSSLLRSLSLEVHLVMVSSHRFDIVVPRFRSLLTAASHHRSALQSLPPPNPPASRENLLQFT